MFYPCPDDQRCPNLFADDGQVDRTDIPAKMARGYFSYIFCDVRAIPLLQRLVSQWPRGLAMVDGEDAPVQIAPGPFAICRRETDGSDFSVPLPMALPEEILKWVASYDQIPKSHSVGFLGSVTQFAPERGAIAQRITQLFPDCLVRTTELPTTQNAYPSGRMGRDEYYKNLQRCKIVLNLRGTGYDTFRFWENAACNAVHVSQKMPLFIPNDFEHGRHILRFSGLDELAQLIAAVLDGRIPSPPIVHEARQHLINFHLTSKRAAYVLDRLKKVFG
jgi:hypothetical protein